MYLEQLETVTKQHGHLIYSNIQPGKSCVLSVCDFLTVATKQPYKGHLDVECSLNYEWHARIASATYQPRRANHTVSDPYVDFEGLFVPRGVNVRLQGGASMQYLPKTNTRSSNYSYDLENPNQIVGTFFKSNRSSIGAQITEILSLTGLNKRAQSNVVELFADAMCLKIGSIITTH